MAKECFLLIWLFIIFVAAVEGESISWIPDSFTLFENTTYYQNSSNILQYQLSIFSNGPIVQHPSGHFRLHISLSLGQQFRPLHAVTRCLSVLEAANKMEDAISETVLGEYPLLPGDDMLLGSLLHTRMVNFYDDFLSTNRSLYTFSLDLTSRHQSRELYNITVTHSTENCVPMRTLGSWHDNSRWLGGKVPDTTDSVTIPLNSGVILVSQNVTVRDLSMYDGELRLFSSSCPSGWTADDRQFNTGKCYRLYDISTDFYQADSICNRVVGEGGSDDRHLMHISDAEENDLARRLCRGSSTLISEARKKGCWIGFHNPSNKDSTSFQWISPSAVGAAVTGKRQSTFLDWRRHEPNNMTVSNATANQGGEQCVHLVAWQNDPHIVEQGSWADDSCAAQRPFLCQVFATTERFSITITNATLVTDGTVVGGVVFSIGQAYIENVYLLNTASWYLYYNNARIMNRVKNVFMMNSARLVVLGHVYLYNGGFIGDIPNLPFYRYIMGISESSNVLTSLLGRSFHNENAQYAQSQVLVTKNGVVSTTAVMNISVSPFSNSYVNCKTSENSYYFGTRNITMEARLVVKGGNLSIAACSALFLKQGGDLARATVNLQDSTSLVSLDGYSSLLSNFDSFNLHSANRGPFIGEYHNGDIDSEFTNMHQGVQQGVFRLSVRSSPSSSQYMMNVTSCIPYNATASELSDILNALPLVQAYGGVSVRRYGDANALNMRFGFSYRIDFDSPFSHNFIFSRARNSSGRVSGGGSLSVAVYCYGLSQRQCGCAQMKVPLTDISGTPNCENFANVSTVDAQACVRAPDVLFVERVSTLSSIDLLGSGQMQYTAGLHRLPPSISSQVRLQGSDTGVGVVSATHIDWFDMWQGGDSRLFVAGTGWAGWESVFDLFAAEWDNERGLAALQRAPACDMQVFSFSINHFASVFSTGPGSNWTWVTGQWNGGVLGGRTHLSIQTYLLMNESLSLPSSMSSRNGTQINNNNRALRDVLTLRVLPNATALWLRGNISLANAATIVNEGIFIIGNAGTGPNGNSSTSSSLSSSSSSEKAFPFAMGEAEYMNESSLATTTASVSLLDIHPGRSWQSYFSRSLVDELRSSWYENPFCGDQCGATNTFAIQGNGELRAMDSSTTTFVLPVYLLDQSRFNLETEAEVNFASGGTFGNDVVVTLGDSARLELSGGRMLMQATCTIQGAGDLQVTGGAHDLSFIIDAQITISGGRLTWPQSRGTGKTITFRGGLVIEQSGQLIVEPQSTVIQVESDVLFTDDSLIQFPVLGIAAQSTPFDGPDFPDTSPRCTLNATKVLRWAGGTIAGKVDIISRSFLYLDGNVKRVESLAKLLNYGHCEWSSGDLVIENQGDFVNYGSIQMALGQAKFDANVVYKGTAIPQSNGGDPFAKEFHTYDLDPGGLNYAEYVALNGKYVSILPGGWTEASQIAGEGAGGLVNH